MRLNSVVLPAPFGPMTLTISCSLTMQVEVVDHGETAEAHRHAAQLERWARFVHQTISTRRRPEQPLRAASMSTISIAPRRRNA